MLVWDINHNKNWMCEPKRKCKKKIWGWRKTKMGLIHHNDKDISSCFNNTKWEYEWNTGCTLANRPKTVSWSESVCPETQNGVLKTINEVRELDRSLSDIYSFGMADDSEGWEHWMVVWRLKERAWEHQQPGSSSPLWLGWQPSVSSSLASALTKLTVSSHTSWNCHCSRERKTSYCDMKVWGGSWGDTIRGHGLVNRVSLYLLH